MQHTSNYNPNLAQMKSRAVLVAAAGAIVFAGMSLVQGAAVFFQAYHFAFLFWNGLSLGCLSGIMLHHLVAGRWGFVTLRFMEAGARVLPLLGVAFLPILLFGMGHLFGWMPGGAHADSELVQLKTSWWLDPALFRLRAVIYILAWTAGAYYLSYLSTKQDQTGDPALTIKLRRRSGIGIPIYFIVMTLMATDWAMSLEPEWFSTIYAPLFIVGQGLATLAFVTIMLSKTYDYKPHSEFVTIDNFHHLGSLMCGFVVLWTYMSFAQFLITYSGNLPEEIPYYLHRQTGGFQYVAVLLIAFHFLLPLLILLQRRVKRAVHTLTFMAFWILAVRMLDLFWVVGPAFHPNAIPIGRVVLYAGALAAFGGLWVLLFLWQLERAALMPLRDPRMDDAFGVAAHESKGALEHAS